MIRVQQEDFNVGTEYECLRDKVHSDGAIVVFTGLVREFNQSCDVTGMFLEHYPGMTEKMLMDIAAEARERWPLNKVSVIHRVGQLYPGDQIVFVGVSSAHREAAFLAAQFIMDFLKTKAPFWKKELTSNGPRWVESQETLADARAHWGPTPG